MRKFSIYTSNKKGTQYSVSCTSSAPIHQNSTKPQSAHSDASALFHEPFSNILDHFPTIQKSPRHIRRLSAHPHYRIVSFFFYSVMKNPLYVSMILSFLNLISLIPFYISSYFPSTNAIHS